MIHKTSLRMSLCLLNAKSNVNIDARVKSIQRVKQSLFKGPQKSYERTVLSEYREKYQRSRIKIDVEVISGRISKLKHSKKQNTL